MGVVDAFYAEIGVRSLARYIDESGKSAQQLNAVGLPTTLLLDREGREIARHVGPAEWDTPEMVTFFRQHLSRDSGALRPHDATKRARSEEHTSELQSLMRTSYAGFCLQTKQKNT